MACILVVDDDPDICDLIRFVLARSGHRVVSAGDGAAGLAAAQELRPDLVLLDWMMPNMTGTELCATLRADPAFANTLIYLVTARAEQADRQNGFLAGADDYVTKPFSPAGLRAQIDGALDLREPGAAR